MDNFLTEFECTNIQTGWESKGLVNKYLDYQYTPKFFKKDSIGEAVDSVTFEEILETISEDTIILKLDVEGAECKVYIYPLCFQMQSDNGSFLSLKINQLDILHSPLSNFFSTFKFAATLKMPE